MIKSIISVGTIFVFIAMMLYFTMNPIIGIDFAKSIISLGFGAIKNSLVFVLGLIK